LGRFGAGLPRPGSAARPFVADLRSRAGILGCRQGLTGLKVCRTELPGCYQRGRVLPPNDGPAAWEFEARKDEDPFGELRASGVSVNERSRGARRSGARRLVSFEEARHDDVSSFRSGSRLQWKFYVKGEATGVALGQVGPWARGLSLPVEVLGAAFPYAEVRAVVRSTGLILPHCCGPNYSHANRRILGWTWIPVGRHRCDLQPPEGGIRR